MNPKQLYRLGLCEAAQAIRQGELSSEPDRALRHASQLECLDAFTIGFMSDKQVEDVIRRIPIQSQAA